MASIDARVTRLEKRVAKLKIGLANEKANVAALKKSVKGVEKWIKAEVKWSKEVTAMLQMIDWASLAVDYPGAGATNPPQTPPDWPMA